MSPPTSIPVTTSCIASALALILLSACGGPEAAPTTDRSAAPAPPVEAVEARLGSLPLEERLHGVVKAKNQVMVRPEIDARVVEVMVESGESVRRGQPLVRLDDATAGQQVRQAEAALRLAEAGTRAAWARVEELRARVVRSRSLAAQELISDLDLETQEAQLAAVEAEAEEAEARVDETRAGVDERRGDLAKTVVRSPVDGRVGQRRVEVGMLVNSATLLFQVGDLDRVIVEVPLTERMLGYVRTEQTVLIRTASDAGEPLRASLSRISPFLGDGSFSTIGEIDLDNREAGLRPGMFVTVDVLYGESQRATQVPLSALWDDPRSGILEVYVVTGLGSDPAPELSESAFGVESRPIEVLARGRQVAGIRGVEPGEWVVTLGQHLLAAEDGASARVRPTTWEQVLDLQGLQREDLLRGFLDKQQRLAATSGAAIPSSEEYLRGTRAGG